MAYPAMLRFLPAGVLGLMVAGLLSAYVSTIVTHLNWGTSYLVHDLYRRFIQVDASERHYVAVGRIVTALLMVLAALLTYVLDTARASFELLLSIGAGTGLLYLLRWFWWRINAWSEIAAMVTSFLLATYFFIAGREGNAPAAHVSLIITVAVTTVVWLTVSLVTPPADRARLIEFYKLVRPAGPGWKKIREEAGLPPSPDSMANALLAWVLGCVFVYAALFGTGSFLYGHTSQGSFWMIALVVSGGWLVGLLRSSRKNQ
jgi:Na+/proline symporter